MTRLLKRLPVRPLIRFDVPLLLRFATILLLAAACIRSVRGSDIPQLPMLNTTHSVSGQFIITRTPGPDFLLPPSAHADTNLIELDASVLSVTAERVKHAVWSALEIKPNTPWRGKVFLVLHSARSPYEDAVIVERPFLNGWTYEIQLPDMIPQRKLVYSLVSVTLLEFANRTAGQHSGEIPAWLADGLTDQLLGHPGDLILSAPGRTINGLLQTRLLDNSKGIDPLAGARTVLRDLPALTFDQLSWPTQIQLSGNDGGNYRASAQLFTAKLLELKNGPAHLCAMLRNLPSCYNWQTAFEPAFRDNFSSPVDIEKWWALQTVAFQAHDPGPLWTAETSRDKLDELLTVSVQQRSSSNSMPQHIEISLQTFVRNFAASEQRPVLEVKLHDIQLAELRMARPLAALTDAYRIALEKYLGETTPYARQWSKHPAVRLNGPKFVQKLNALDIQRHAIASTIRSERFKPQFAP